MDSTEKFRQLVDKEKYQVFLCACPGNIPFSFALHPWFVINKQGSISRWEVLFRKHACEMSWGYLHKNAFSLFKGIHIFPFSNSNKYFWKGELLGQIEGDVAKRMIEFIESSPTAYPYCDTYSLNGPNSNTYVQWVLNNFPEFPIALPWNSFGKGYGNNL